MNDSESPIHLDKSEFTNFISNDFFHLTKVVENIKGDVSFVKGTLTVITPLILSLLGIILVMLMRG